MKRRLHSTLKREHRHTTTAAATTTAAITAATAATTTAAITAAAAAAITATTAAAAAGLSASSGSVRRVARVVGGVGRFELRSARSPPGFVSCGGVVRRPDGEELIEGAH